jgi:hypothetical protein
MESLIVNVICAVFSLIALASVVWVLVTGRLGLEGLDALFLIVVALLIAAAFSWLPIQALREGKLKQWANARRPAAPAAPPQVARAATPESRERPS